MKLKHYTILFITIMLLSMVAALSAGEKTAQKTCPVMGGEVNKSLHVEQDGKRIYVCCEGCIDEVKNNFSKYVKQLNDDGQSVEVVAASDKKHDCNDCKKVDSDKGEKSCTTEAKIDKSCCSSSHKHSKAKKENCSTGNCK